MAGPERNGSTLPDPRAVLAALGVEDATVTTPVAGGSDTTIWRVERPGATWALRLFRTEQARTCERELQAMAVARRAGLPVPAVHANGTWNDRPALLLSWVDGQSLGQALGTQPWRTFALGVAFGRAQARVHSVVAPDPLRQEADGWITWAGPGHGALLAHLRSMPLSPDALLHLDYHPLNVLADAGEITGIIDWANARAGDPRADVARTLTILRLAPRPAGVPVPAVATVLFLLELGWRRGYAQIAGPPGPMAPFYAWAGAVMERDLAPKVGRPGIGLTERHIRNIRRWTAHWTRRASIPT